MSKLKIALQKQGRLSEESIRLLRNCGIAIENGEEKLKVSARNFPLEVLYLRNADIPQYLEDGVADIGIVGKNILVEQQKKVKVVEHLGFSRCRLCLAVPKDIETEDLSFFAGKKIATSYPNTLRRFLQSHNIQAEIHKISGSVEIAPNIGLADGICDLVSSGSTLFKNGLREMHTILESEAVLARGSRLAPDKSALLDKLLFRIRAVLRAAGHRYILMNVPTAKVPAISRILPVLRSPTVLPLAQEGWSSLHSVIAEDRLWQVIDELQAAGAEGILVIPIDKMII